VLRVHAGREAAVIAEAVEAAVRDHEGEVARDDLAVLVITIQAS
jgi:hypothetical protein